MKGSCTYNDRSMYVLAYSKVKKFSTIIYLLFLSFFCRAQIPSATFNKLFPLPASTPVFNMPTATDVINYNGLPLQVVISTAPTPILHFDNYIGITGNIPVVIFGTSTVFLDDVSLAQNGGDVYAYITCRVLNGANLDLYLIRYKWDVISNTFNTPGFTLLGTRPLTSSTDPFDRISVDAPKNPVFTTTPSTAIDIIWQKNGSIYLRRGTVSFPLGNIGSNNEFILFQGGSVQYPGLFSCPDVVGNAEFNGGSGHRVVSVLYKHAATQKLLITFDDAIQNGVFPYQTPVITAYTVTGPARVIRTPRVDMPYKYFYALCFNEYDNTTKKSNIVVVANPMGAVPTVLPVINSELESLCTNNTNYKLTGFPNIKFTAVTAGVSVFETVWQQVACSGTNFCTINAVSKRFQWNSNAPITQPAPIGNQFLHINQTTAKNSFFPCLASLQGSCSNFYSFGIMDKTTSAGGKIGYKQTFCNTGSLRPSNNNVNGFSKATNGYVYPNPVNDFLLIDMRDEKGIYTAELINTNGATVKSKIIEAGRLIKLNVLDISNGHYFLKLAAAGKPTTFKKVWIIHQ